MSASLDLLFAMESSKYASKMLYGIVSNTTEKHDFREALNKQMLFQVLGDYACYSELTEDERSELIGVLKLSVQ